MYILSLSLSEYTDIWNICTPYVIAVAIGCNVLVRDSG